MKKIGLIYIIRLIFPVWIASLMFNVVKAQDKKIDKKQFSTSLINVQLPRGFKESEIELNFFPTVVISAANQFSDAKLINRKERIHDGRVSFKVELTEPMKFWGSILDRKLLSLWKQRVAFFLEPGETIDISYDHVKPLFKGQAGVKFELIYKLNAALDSLHRFYVEKKGIQGNREKPAVSVSDYWLWNELLNKQLKVTDSLLTIYEGRISAYANSFIRENAYDDIETSRFWQFSGLILVEMGNLTKNKLGLTNQDLCAIYDTTVNNYASKWLRYEAPVVSNPHYLFHMIRLDSYRNVNWFYPEKSGQTFDIGEERADDYVSRYYLAKQKYTGIRRDQTLAFMFYSAIGFLKSGFDSKVEAILEDFYSIPVSDPGYHEVVKDHEARLRKRAGKVTTMKDFTLKDMEGKSLTLAHTKNKVTIFDFWFTGCSGCVQMVPALTTVQEHFRNNKNVTFFSVSIDQDRNKWLNSIRQGKYTTKSGLHAYTGGQGDKHPLIREHNITGYPTLLILDGFGNVARLPKKADPRVDEGKALIGMIETELVRMKDGPYVFEEKGGKMVYTVSGTKFSITTPEILTVQTDKLGQTFRIELQKEVLIQPSVSTRPNKLMSLSDIEGNFDKFRMLLQNNKIIDENYNWTFGKGHLVFAGDMFDRGEQVTECLWLIYSLEEKAKAKGGEVHFILGNHEIMNLQGKFRYVQQKYKSNASTMGKSLIQLYAKNTELGKWLRTKNIVEKVGDLLFAHGGFSSRINRSSLTIDEINNLARPYLDNDLGENNYPEANTNIVMSQVFGPFWYRGYYVDEEKQALVRPVIDSILNKYAAKHIITGHTIIADTISVLYNNKVINTDVPHAKGKSEALLIEGSNFYRVNDKGQRFLLFKDPEQNPE